MEENIGIKTANNSSAIPSRPSRSTFVTGLALVSIIAGLFLSVTDIVGLVSYISLTNNSEYQMAMSLMQTYEPNAGSLLLNSQWMLTSSIISLALNVAMAIIAFALFRRIKWGRVSFITLVYIQTAFYIGSSIGGYFMAQSFLGQPGVGQLLGGSGIIAFGGFATAFSIIIILATAVFIVWKLSSPVIREEFNK